MIIRQIILLIMRSSILVGGQAVINGVMMRVPGAYATAVRIQDGSIKSKAVSFISLSEKNKIFKLPILRGAINLFEAMKIGYSTLTWSASFTEDEDKKPNLFIEIIMNIISIIFAMSLFLFLPIFIASYSVDPNNVIIFNIISGAVRITLFLIYLILISMLKDVKILFQYHGAEHKTIFTFEDGQELCYEKAKQYKKEHPRCGTSFLFIVMMVAIFSFSLIDSVALLLLNIELSIINRLILHLFCMPLVAGFSYEVLKILARNMGQNKIIDSLAMPGLFLQKITTKNPNKDQLEVAFEALKVAFGDRYNSIKGKKFKADAIG